MACLNVVIKRFDNIREILQDGGGNEIYIYIYENTSKEVLQKRSSELQKMHCVQTNQKDYRTTLAFPNVVSQFYVTSSLKTITRCCSKIFQIPSK